MKGDSWWPFASIFFFPQIVTNYLDEQTTHYVMINIGQLLEIRTNIWWLLGQFLRFIIMIAKNQRLGFRYITMVIFQFFLKNQINNHNIAN